MMKIRIRELHKALDSKRVEVACSEEVLFLPFDNNRLQTKKQKYDKIEKKFLSNKYLHQVLFCIIAIELHQ